MDIRLTDYGVSQFLSPSGLRSMKGTEEYMAPELCRYGEQSFYDEKVSESTHCGNLASTPINGT